MGGGGKSESEIPICPFLEFWTKIYCLRSTVHKPACASQIASHILRMWRLKREANKRLLDNFFGHNYQFYPPSPSLGESLSTQIYEIIMAYPSNDTVCLSSELCAIHHTDNLSDRATYWMDPEQRRGRRVLHTNINVSLCIWCKVIFNIFITLHLFLLKPEEDAVCSKKIEFTKH